MIFKINQWVSKHKTSLNFFLVMWTSLAMWLYSDALIIELPFLVPYLPEGWRLGSWVTFMKGTSTFSLILLPIFLKPGLIRANFICYGLGFLLSVSLVMTWDKVLPPCDNFPSGLSLGFLITSFCLFGLDAIRMTLIYMLADKMFGERYVTANLIGDTLGGLFATILSYIQGYKIYFKKDNLEVFVDGKPVENERKNDMFLSTDFVFGPETALIIFAVIYSSTCVTLWIMIRINPETLRSMSKKASDYRNVDDEKVFLIPNVENPNLGDGDCQTQKEENICAHGLFQNVRSCKAHMYCMFGMWFVVIATCFTLMPSFFTFTTIPYSQRCFNLSVAFWGVSMPLIAIVAHYTPMRRLISYFLLLLIHIIICFILLFIASKSPNPPFVGNFWGETVVIGLWAAEASTGYFLYSKVFYELSKMKFDNAIKWGSVAAQLGNVGGSLLGFLLVNMTDVFHDYWTKWTYCKSVI